MANEATNIERKPSEEALSKIWIEVLRLPSLDADANFFDIGGDSLKAMEVIMRVSDDLQVDLPLIAFFEDPTVTHLAAVVDELKGTATSSPITRVPGRREFPLSYSQQVFWLLEQQNPGNGIYNTTRIFRVRGSVDPAVLERSLNELRRRHESLRVRFIQGVNGPVQVVETPAPLQLAVTDLSGMEAGAREQAAMKLALETVKEPFNLSTGPVLRARLVRLNSDEYLLCMAVHHVVSDGFTGSILLDELGAIYDAFAAGEPHALPELELHFTDYAAWEQEWMQGSRLAEDLEYWRTALQGAPAMVDVPTDIERTSDPDRAGRLHTVTISREILQQAQALAQSNGTTLFAILAAAMRALLYRWSGQADFLLGTLSSNRSRSGTERMIGCFVNPLPIRNPIRDGQTVLDLLNSEKSAVMDVFAHQDCPFAKIVEAVNPERTSSDNPFFNVAFMLQNFPVIARDGRNFHAENLTFDAQVALLDLRIFAMETQNGLQVSCEYKSPLFSEATVDALLHGFGDVLQAIAKDPAALVSGIALSEALTRQASASRRRDHIPSVAITASFTAQPLEEPLNFLLGELGMKYRVSFAPYQQVFQQLLDPASMVRTADGFGIVLVRFEDWLHHETGPALDHRDKVEQLTGELITALHAVQGGAAPVIVCFCPPSQAVGDVARESFESLEAQVADAFAGSNSVQVIRSGKIFDLYPVEEYEDEYSARLSNMPYTTDFFSALGTMLARRMWSVAENHYTVIAMDCDQVLWDGRCGEDRRVVADGPRLALQNALLEQSGGGILLCLSSKNREEDVWAAFESNSAMPLQRDHIVAAAIGPQAGAERLRNLAGELGLGLDSFIFLSADAEECAGMESACPEVLTLAVPAEAEEIPAWLKHVWAFDRFRDRDLQRREGMAG